MVRVLLVLCVFFNSAQDYLCQDAVRRFGHNNNNRRSCDAIVQSSEIAPLSGLQLHVPTNPRKQREKARHSCDWFFSPRRVPKDFAHKNSKIDNFTLESCVASESCPPVNVGHYLESKAGQVTCNYCCRLVVCVKTTTTFHVVVLLIPRTFSCVVASTAPTIRRSRLSVISCL